MTPRSTPTLCHSDRSGPSFLFRAFFARRSMERRNRSSLDPTYFFTELHLT
jgi:hypothetical protein